MTTLLHRAPSIAALGALVLTLFFAAADAHSARAALPPSTTSGIHLAQVFDYGQPVVNGSVVGQAGAIDYVWGASGNPANVPAGPTWHEDYIPWARDPQLHPTSWFTANHPTWIMYTADRRTPATTYSQSTPVLDTTNPDVQAWFRNLATQALSLGYQGISWDNGIVSNDGRAVGHYDSAGHWVQQYTGAVNDPAYASAQASAFAAVSAGIKHAYPGTSETLNSSFQCISTWSLPLVSADMVLDEAGFTNYGATSYTTTSPGAGCTNPWLQKVQAYVALQKTQGKGLVLINEEPYRVAQYMTNTNTRARLDVQWSLANYLLVNYGHTYFWWGGSQQYGQSAFVQFEYSAPIGSPTDDFHLLQGVYVRDYSGGMALVNPSPVGTFTVRLPAGYSDLYGRAWQTLVMPPHTGDVLILSKRK